MIKTNGLRIGNIFHPIQRNTEIHLPVTLIFLKIIEISSFTVKVYQVKEDPAILEQWQEYQISDLSPVPLTPEILDKCDRDQLNRMDLKHIFPLGKIAFPFNETYTELWYLHDLQNIYFDLFGEELKINN